MSFSSEVKDELSKVNERARHCQTAELLSLCAIYGYFSDGDKNFFIIKSEGLTVAKKSYILLKRLLGVNPEVKIQTHINPLRKSEYSILLVGDDAKRLKELLKLKGFWGFVSGAEKGIYKKIIQSTCCKRAFLRGIFLGAGSVTNPEKSYHLEIVLPTSSLAEVVQDVMGAVGIEAKMVIRKGNTVVYVKDASKISEFFSLTGASISMLNFENVRVVKDVRNNVNRQVNCETANIGKTVGASHRQLEDIRIIQNRIGLENLSVGLKEMAYLRLDYPDASLSELAEMMGGGITRSGVNHRLRRLSQIAAKL